MNDQALAALSAIHFLQSMALLEGVSQGGIQTLAGAGRWRRVPRGAFLFFQNDPAEAVYLLRRGAVALLLENLDGRELIINEMGPGDCFGELGVLTGGAHSTSAVSIVESDILVIPACVFLGVLHKEPAMALALLEITARRLQDSSKREEALAFQDAQQRLARLLVSLEPLPGETGYLTLSQEELAQRAGVTRQTVATILGRWRRRGWLLTGRGHIVLLNRTELNLLAQDEEPGS